MVATSDISHGSGTLDAAWTMRSRPKIEISLAGQKSGLVNSYTTGDNIDGIATITVDHDTPFDEIEIVLQGSSRSIIVLSTIPDRRGAEQVFLKLRQPIDETEYPRSRILESGRSYPFPFTFVVPDRLLPYVCRHPKRNARLERSHTMLPPSLGDLMLANNGKKLLDDMAPHTSQISYLVRVAVLKNSSTEDHDMKPLAAVAKKVGIIPTVEEEPPLNISGKSSYYCMRKEKNVKRGLLRGKIGRLVASSSQPQPIQLLAPNCEASDSVGTIATVHLRFDPVGHEQPPRLDSISRKLRVNTFYGASPWDDFPCSFESMSLAHTGRGLFTEVLSLSTMCVALAQWVKHSGTDAIRRDSCQSTSSAEESAEESTYSPSCTGNTYYTASVVVPITLPNSKAFVPTFYSCLVSRVYTLDLSLSYHTPATNVLAPTISLHVPIQLTSRAKYPQSQKAMGVVVTQSEVDQYFEPRSISPSRWLENVFVEVDPATSHETRSLAPPEYRETTTSSVAVTASF